MESRHAHQAAAATTASTAVAAAAATTPAVAFFVTGGLSGVVAHTCVAPYERARLLLQLGTRGGMSKVLRKIYLEDGVFGYFRGNLVNCWRQFLSKGLLFGFNDLFKAHTQRFARLMGQILNHSSSTHTKGQLAAAFVSGSMAGVSTQLLTYPIDVIRVRFSAHMGATRYTGFFATLGHTLREEGPTALYRGATPTIYGAVVYEGIKFGTFDLYMHLLSHYLPPPTGTHSQSQSQSPSPSPVLAGTLTGITAVCITHPNDTVRRRMQMQGLGGMPKLYRHTLHAYQTILRVEGARSFYNGLVPAVLGKVPAVAIQFTIYHGIKKGLKM